MRYAVLALLLLCACSADSNGPGDSRTKEEAFEDAMRGAVLEGHFTVSSRDGQPDQADSGDEAVRLRTERYELQRVVHFAGDMWTFMARIQFGEHDVTVPVPVKVVWAGDTPMASVTDLGLPGLGTYTARVVFYRDSYAGMWSGREHGGHLFGRIVRPDPEE